MKPEYPITRIEQYLDKLTGGEGVKPDYPITRIEQYLNEMVESGGGGVNPDDVAEIIADFMLKGARYGVSGVGQEASALTRIWDAVGMTAQVGTDGDNSAVVNDFDIAYPFMRRKCVGNWTMSDDGKRGVFNVQAYYGDPDYAEDGSKGDYVAVECPLCYYYFQDGILAVSGYPYEGYRPFDIFCRDHDQEQTIDKYYLPAYALALKDGHAVSLPGYDNEQNHYQGLTNACRTYGDGTGVAALAHLQPMAVNFYEWALMTVEFAQQNIQNVMQGCCNLRSADADKCTFLDETHVVATGQYLASRVAGEYITITTSTSHVAWNYKATHRIVSNQRCDSDGTVNASGSYNLIEVEDLGKGYFTYNTETEYQFAGRPYRSGACGGVSTPSGSPTNNNSGYYPCRYRWRENPYSNQFKTVADLFNRKLGTGDNDYFLSWHYLLDPSTYTPATSSKPDAADLATDKFVELDVVTEHANYVSGYIKSKKYSEDYPDIWIPYETTGGGASVYYADYASLVNSHALRAVRVGGAWYSGPGAGPSNVSAPNAPSSGYAASGGDLCFPQ